MDRGSGSKYLRDYLDFDLEIREGDLHGYSVAVHSPAGEAEEEMRFPFDERQLRDRLKDLEIALLRSGGTRRSLSSEEQTVQDFGRSLFEAVLIGRVGTCYYRSMDQAHQQGKGLRLKLHVQPPSLTVLPWEFLYDPDRDEYLCFSRDTPIVRYTDLRQPVERLTVAPPLRILGMVASPRDLDPLDVEHEKGLMDEAIEGLQADGLVELTWLEGDTWRDLHRAMRRGGPWHIFHFVGHGDFDMTAVEGLIAIAEERTGRRHLLRSRDLARLLDGHPSLRLVFLNSCEGARGSDGDPFSGTAATLVRRGIPAVVAMQYQITDQAAIGFSSAFYESLADGLPVDAAVTEARVAVSMDSMLEWGTPVLYMRSPDGRLFDLSVPAPIAHPTPETEDRQEADALRRYREAVESAWADRKLQENEVRWLGHLANDELGIGPGAAAGIEREVMGGTIESILERQKESSRRLEELYAQARRLHQDHNWQAVVDLFEQIRAEEPAYPDPERLLASSTDALVAERVAALYDRGKRHMRAREWQQALECFEAVQRLEEGYEDTKRLLAQVLRELARPPKVKVPDLIGQEIRQASNTLANNGLHLGARDEVPNEMVPQGKIIEQSPRVGIDVEEGSSVNIAVSSGPQRVIVTPPSGTWAGGRHWWALASRGLLLAIFGLLIAFFNEAPDSLKYGATAMIYGVLVITNGILAIIDIPRGAGRRHLLQVEGRISLLVGSAALLVGLVASVLYSANGAVANIVSEYTGAVVFYVVAFWAICVGAIRTVAAIRLGWGFKGVRLMLISGALLVVFGVLIFLKLWDPRLVLGIWPLASGSFLMGFAFQVRLQERSGTVG